MTSPRPIFRPPPVAVSLLLSLMGLYLTPATLPAQTSGSPPAQGLVLFWKLDETTGLVAQDASGQGRDGTLNNYAGDDSQWVAGHDGGGLAFTNNYVSISGLPELQSTTWAAWVKLTTATPDYDAVISATFPGATAGHSLGFYTGDTALHPRVLWNHNLGTTSLVASNAVTSGEWNHLAMTYDASSETLKLYVNGDIEGEATNVSTTPFTSINLGQREATGGNPLRGVLDDVVVYDRALTLEEVQGLAGKVVSGPPVFTQQPISVTVYQGLDASFSVKVDGQSPFTYQWYQDGQAVPDATNDVLALTNVQPDQGGTYTVVAKNAAGETTSDPATLTVTSVTDLSTGLQAHWKFDETTGLTAADSSGNGNDGTLMNFAGDDSQWITGETNGALAFDGADYVQVPDSPSIGSKLVSGFTVAAWFRSNVPLSANGSTYRMLEKGNSYFFLQGVGNGGMNFLVKHGGANVTASIGESLEANRWYHITGVFDGSDIRVYLNGDLRGTNHVGGPIDDAGLPLVIGADDAGSYLDGAMDDVEIWDRPLSDREVLNILGRDLPNPPSILNQPTSVTKFAGATATFSVEARGEEPFRYLWYKDGQPIRSATEATLVIENIQASDAGEYKVQVSNDLGDTYSDPVTLQVTPVTSLADGREAYWKFDETSGLTASDSSPNHNDGTLTDFADSTSEWVSGQVNGALQFDGTASRVVVPNSSSFDLGDEATFSFWIKPASYGSERSATSYNLSEGRILRKGGQFDIETVDDPGSVRQTIRVNGVNPPQNVVELNQWQHFTVVFRNGTVAFYKNGFPLGDPVPGTLGAANTNALTIGNYDETLDTPRLYDGTLDDLGIWLRPLSESEILELAGRDVSGPPVIVTQPQPISQLEGNSATLQFFATGLRPVTYQWFHDGEAIPGATSNRLSFAKLTVDDAGSYTLSISNAVGQVTSDPIQVTVQSIKDVTTGLIAYYNFDETSGNILHDSSGNGNDATLQGNPAQPGVAGQIGGAFNFDGASDFAVAPANDSLNVSDQLTISAWIDPTVYAVSGGYGRIVRKGINYDLSLRDDIHSLNFYGINKTAYTAPNNAIDLSVWQQVAVVFKNGTVQFFKNGQSVTDPMPGQIGAVDPAPLVIGNFQPDLNINRLFSGSIDDLGIWNRALTGTEIDGIYENGLLGKPLTAIFEPLNIRTLESPDASHLKVTFFSPYSDRTYEVQSRTNLSDASWTTLSGVQFNPLGQGLTEAVFPLPSPDLTFFRVAAEPPPPLFFDDFESGAPGWTHGGAQDNWELGTPTTGPGHAFSGQNVWATGLSSNYLPFTDSYLRSPVVDLTGVKAATLQFEEYRNVDPEVAFHGTIVNVLDASTLSVITELARDAGSTPDWQLRTFKLGPDVLGHKVIFEFRLYSDNFNLLEGWFLDNVAVLPE